MMLYKEVNTDYLPNEFVSNISRKKSFLCISNEHWKAYQWAFELIKLKNDKKNVVAFW